MVGITSFGAYVPLWRLSRDEIARAWNGSSLGGERAVANWDEDSITMAVSAAQDCIGNLDRQKLDGLYFASTNPPYKEKQSSSMVGLAVDLPRDSTTADFTDTLRCGTSAIRAAVDAVKGGTAKNILVAVADCRLGVPRSDAEQIYGDGAAALIIGDSDVIASVEGTYSIYEEINDVWRSSSDQFPRSWEDRFVITQGYQKSMTDAVTGLLRKYEFTPKDFAKAILYGPDPRNHAAMAKTLGFDAKSQVQDPLFSTVGNTGCAAPVMQLVAALEDAKPGDRLLLASYGDGSDALILKVTDNIVKFRQSSRRGIKGHIASKNNMSSYEKYVRLRELMSGEGARRPANSTSAAALFRDRHQVVSLHGSKCTSCGNIHFPQERVCPYCQAKDTVEDVRLAESKGIVFTYTQDFLAASADPPNTMTVVDLDQGARIFCMMTDRVPEEVKVDMPIEMTFRLMHDTAGIRNYFWKSRPIR